jgi:hypothetical protein
LAIYLRHPPHLWAKRGMLKRRHQEVLDG